MFDGKKSQFTGFLFPIFSGLLPEEIAQIVKLPRHLQEHPYLQQFYGTVEWSCKAVFNQYMGWFSGKPSELHPLPPKVVNNQSK